MLMSAYNDQYKPNFDCKMFFDFTLRESHEVSERVIRRLFDLYERYPSFRELIHQLWETNGKEAR